MSEGNGFVSAADVLAPMKREFAEYEISTLGKKVRLRNLNERERGAYEVSGLDSKGNWNRERSARMKGILLQLCVVDKDGNLVFSPADVDKLMETSADVVAEIFDRCCEHCNFGNKPKNSSTVPVD